MFKRTGYEGNEYYLLNKNTELPFNVGDAVTTWDEKVVLVGGTAPYKPGSTGRVIVKDERGRAHEYFPSVINAAWVKL